MARDDQTTEHDVLRSRTVRTEAGTAWRRRWHTRLTTAKRAQKIVEDVGEEIEGKRGERSGSAVFRSAVVCGGHAVLIESEVGVAALKMMPRVVLRSP